MTPTLDIATRTARIAVANAALTHFASRAWLELRERVRGGPVVYVCWTTHKGARLARQWMTSGQSFYPRWYRLWGYGGTCTIALAQLVRWVQGRPVLPLAAWRYWCSPKILLSLVRGIDHGAELLAVLTEGGYPDAAACVLCGVALDGFDWWSLDGVSGPCCRHTEGCRQGGVMEEATTN